MEETESNIKKSIKPKQAKKPKTIKERREPLKRTKHPESWKVNIKKNARLRGEEYVGVGGNCNKCLSKEFFPLGKRKFKESKYNNTRNL